MISCLFPLGRKCKHSKETIEEKDDNPRLPEDIIFDVLSRLPVKPLCRFRCVSKGWRALMSDPAFAAAQSSRAASAARPLIVGMFGKPWPIEKFSPLQPSRVAEPSAELRVMDTADGSVLRVIKDVKSTKLVPTRLDLVFVDQGLYGGQMINPATGLVVVVPGSKDPTADHRNRVLCHSSFGCATPSGTYKVVRIRDTSWAHGGRQLICEVATLEDPTWRQRPEPPILTCRCSNCSATVDGTLYFLDRDAAAHANLPSQAKPQCWNRIAAFDLESEEWKTTLNGPPFGYPKEKESWDTSLAELRKGTLSMVQAVRSIDYPSHRYTNIWRLVNPDKSVWVKECTIRMNITWRLFKALEIFGDGRILMLNAFHKENELLSDIPCFLQLYDPSTRTLTDLMEMPEGFRGGMTLYTGSLLSLDRLTIADNLRLNKIIS
ncbi:hypothetical protein QOZ80_2BG0187660 [Eleusine coracana subsp. coracana]|nr:hypothetical protein QOZ80_2BG0187660 [Eleusine coracana subsp. coracana]